MVLLSGGLDSATVLAMAKSEGYEVFALSFAYGQRHSWELEAARRVARRREPRSIRLPRSICGCSADPR